MPKAIAGAAMLAAFVGLALIPGLGWTILTTPWLLSAMGGLLATGLTMEAGAIADALTSNRGQNITTRMVSGLRQVIYGMQRVGGVTIYQSTTGAGGSGGNYVFNFIIALAAHQIDGYVNVFFDGRQVYWSQGPNPHGYHANIGCGSVAVPPTATATISGGQVTGITATGGSGFSDVKPQDGFRVRITGGGGSGASAWAYNAGPGGYGTNFVVGAWTVVMESGGHGYISAPDVEIQGAFTFGGAGAADVQDPGQSGYGLGYGIGPGGQHYDFSGKVYCEARFGDQIPGDTMASLVANDSAWGASTTIVQATATAVLPPGAGPFPVVGVNVDVSGAGYTSPPAVSFSGGGGSGATAVAYLSGSGVIRIQVTNGGSGYGSAPTVIIGAPNAVGAGTPQLLGVAYLYINVGYDPSQFASPPEIRVTMTGKNDIYDPRTSATGYSTNWALQVADIIGNTGNGIEPALGLADGPITAWPAAAIDQLIAAANVCDETIATSQGDETNWPQHIHYDTSVSPGDALQMMMPTASGRLSRIGGGWYIWPAYWQGPSFSFDDSALIGTPQWTPTRSFKDLINRVNGTYIAPNYPYNVEGNLYDSNGWYYGTINNVWPMAWQPTNFPQYAQDVLHGYAADEWLIEDGGIQLPKEVALHGCISIVQAQRAAKVLLLRNRFQGAGTFPMQLAAWQMQPTDVMEFTFPALGWLDKVLEITGTRFLCQEQKSTGEGDAEGDKVLALSVSVSVCETDPSIYEWSIDEELTPYDVPAAPSQIPQTPAAPSSMSVVSDAATSIAGADGIVQPRALVAWTAPSDISVVQIQLQYQLSGAGAWSDGGTVDVGLFEALIGPLVAGQTYNFQIRSLRVSGTFSPWVQIFGLVASTTLSAFLTSGVNGPVAPPGTLTAVTTGSSSSTILVANFVATCVAFTASCVPSPSSFTTGIGPQQLWYAYFIDPSFVGGTVTPILTQNQADFANKPGYFLIGQILTPPYVPGGGGGGVPGRYSPSNNLNNGMTTPISPANAYDNNLTTCAQIYGLGGGSAGFGDVLYEDFPAVSSVSGQSLYVNAAVLNPSGAWWAITACIGSSGSKPAGPLGTSGGGYTLNNRGAWAATTAYAQWDYFASSGVEYLVVTGYTSGASFGSTDIGNCCYLLAVGLGAVAQTTYSVALPASTPLSGVTVDVTADQGGCYVEVYEIYVQ